MESDVTSRDEIAQAQVDRLPALWARMKVHPRPKQALEQAARDDAIELAAAEVVESGRDFAQVNEDERRALYEKYYAYCVERNAKYLYSREMIPEN